jgi:putative SOS response-associated peptidase YedK
MEPDSGTTSIRNTSSKHWKRWLGADFRCIVPMSSFSESNRDAGGDIWFALDESRPLVCFAGCGPTGRPVDQDRLAKPSSAWPIAASGSRSWTHKL